MPRKLSAITTVTPAVIASADLTVETPGEGFLDITAEARKFLESARARDGALLLFLRHTSASLTIQENADPDVLRDLTSALRHLAPRDFGWVHDAEGPDDMPAHVRAMLTGISLQIPVADGQMTLGTWQGIYLVEHRARPHRRQIVLQFTGSAD
ncbi:MAG: secondary thiamine-phosphate synthase enzyme YjbQ [Pseudorhodoplanes sp.]